MRVAIVCPYDLSKPGGVQEQVKGLRLALRRMGDEVVLIAPGAGHDDDAVDLGGTVSLPGNRSVVPISIDPRLGRRIRQATSGVDVVHVHEPLMPMASLLALRCGRPVVATFHAAPGRMWRALYRLIAPWFGRILGPRLRAVTAVSRTAAAPLPARIPVSIVPNGVDVASFQTDGARSDRRVCFLGRDEPRKGLDVLLEAWEEVTAKVPDAELVVMGAEREDPGVVWLGRVDETEKIEVLTSSTVFVAPNLGRESFGIVLVEAMASGCAVVASNLPSFAEVMGAGTGISVPPGDRHRLAQALVTLLEDPDQARRMAEAGRDRSRRFDWSSVAAAYRALYEQALS